jgi:DNA-binding response OmpR family regulator
MTKIAIIDDDISVRNSLEIVLRAQGHVILSFPDPKNFLSTADATQFDLLLVDNDMPHMTGLELYQWLKSHFTEYPKFVLMSGRVQEEVFLRSDLAQEISLLEKPFNLAKLLDLMGS